MQKINYNIIQMEWEQWGMLDIVGDTNGFLLCHFLNFSNCPLMYPPETIIYWDQICHIMCTKCKDSLHVLPQVHKRKPETSNLLPETTQFQNFHFRLKCLKGIQLLSGYRLRHPIVIFRYFHDSN